MRQRREQRLVEQLITQPPIEALDKGVLNRLSGVDVMPIDPGLLGPAKNGVAGQLGAVVADDSLRSTAPCDQKIELAGNP